MWIQQEVILSPKPVICCGSLKLGWDVFEAGLVFVHLIRHHATYGLLSKYGLAGMAADIPRPVQFGFQITYNLPCSESYTNAVRAIILSGDVDLLALSNRKKLENAFLGARLEDVYEDSERRFPLGNAILRNEGPPRTRQHPQSQGMGRPSRARGMHCRSSRPHELSLASRCSWL